LSQSPFIQEHGSLHFDSLVQILKIHKSFKYPSVELFPTPPKTMIESFERTEEECPPLDPGFVLSEIE